MAWRTWTGLALVALGVALAFVAAAGGEPWYVASAAAFLVGLAVWSSGLRFWRRLAPRSPPMPDLIQRPRAGERWCARCGRPAPRRGPCPVCGVAAARERRKRRRLQRKQRVSSQEKKT